MMQEIYDKCKQPNSGINCIVLTGEGGKVSVDLAQQAHLAAATAAAARSGAATQHGRSNGSSGSSSNMNKNTNTAQQHWQQPTPAGVKKNNIIETKYNIIYIHIYCRDRGYI
jgi:hypothetical protein